MNKFKTLLINPHKIESATTITITNDNFENAKKCGNDYFNVKQLNSFSLQ